MELLLKQPGFTCGVGECTYAARVQASITSHHKKVHFFSHREVLTVVVQMLFSGVGKKYFTVSPSLRSQSTHDPFSVLLTLVLPNMPPLKSQVTVQGRKIPPLYQVTQWWEILGQNAVKQESRKAVIALAALPCREEQGLSMLPPLCWNYLVWAQAASKNASFTASGDVPSLLCPKACYSSVVVIG